jgi:glycosyltransferase involved in cell wall biosynthesis
MRLSVALCTYNGAPYLKDQLDSILEQSRKPYELVVCDDSSTDDTPLILQDFQSRAPFPVHIHVNSERFGSTRNFARAIEFTSGEIIVLSDQDDLWLPHKLSRIEERFSSKSLGILFSDADLIDENGASLNKRLCDYTFSHKDREQFNRGRAFDVLRRYNVITGATMAFDSKFLSLILPMPGGIKPIHDGWIAMAISAVSRVEFIDEPLIKYRQHTSQQIGAPLKREPFVEKLKASLQRDYNHQIDVRHLELLYQRIKSSPWATDHLLEEIRSNIEHYNVRDSMPLNRMRRIPRLVRELTRFRYHRYSNGFRSFAKDLIL